MNLQPVAPEIWSASRPLRFLGVEVGTRMTVVKLDGGGLFVHSPIALTPELREEVDALGTVAAIVAPNLYHHLFAGEWAKAYPKASLSCCPGLPKKRPDIAWSRELGDEPESEWKATFDQVCFRALAIQNEIVFFHRKTKTMISSDVVFDLASHPSAMTRAASWVFGNRTPGPTILERLLIRDRAAAHEQIGRMVAWGADRIVIAHGSSVEANGSAVLEKGYAWLRPSGGR